MFSSGAAPELSRRPEGAHSASDVDSLRLRLGGLVLFLVEFTITMSLFYVAECVRHGCLVALKEAFNFGDGQ